MRRFERWAPGRKGDVVSLEAVKDLLRCPVCGMELRLRQGSLSCEMRHQFDLAKQGYVNLGVSGKDARADTPAMVQARTRVQEAGVFESVLQETIRQSHRLPLPAAPTIVDLAGGTGYYCAGVIEAYDSLGVQARGIVADLSVAALKRAAKQHPRIGAVATDLTRALPIVSGSVDLILSVFGPRNSAEMRRVLTPQGACIVVTPTSAHLAELIVPLGMLRVAHDKPERLRRSMAGFSLQSHTRTQVSRPVTPELVCDVVEMGPSAHHISAEELRARVTELMRERAREDICVTVSCDVTVFRP